MGEPVGAPLESEFKKTERRIYKVPVHVAARSRFVDPHGYIYVSRRFYCHRWRENVRYGSYVFRKSHDSSVFEQQVCDCELHSLSELPLDGNFYRITSDSDGHDALSGKLI